MIILWWKAFMIFSILYIWNFIFNFLFHKISLIKNCFWSNNMIIYFLYLIYYFSKIFSCINVIFIIIKFYFSAKEVSIIKFFIIRIYIFLNAKLLISFLGYSLEFIYKLLKCLLIIIPSLFIISLGRS